MGTEFDRVWAEAVCDVCDPVFAATDVGFVRQIHVDPGPRVTALLWEAAPVLFAARYPDSGIVEAYGDQWSQVTCIDFWVYVDGELRQARTSTEGWDFAEQVLDLTGVGATDGQAIGDVMARILRVAPPQV